MSLTHFIGKLLWHGQKFLVYPSAYLEKPRHVLSPEHYSLNYENIELLTADRIILRCYLLRPAKTSSQRKPEASEISEPIEQDAVVSSRGSVIMFHGNGMNYGDCVSGARHIVKMGYTVLILSYRGYAHSDGLPSEKGLRKDAQAALDYLLADNELSQKPIILYGHSLGGAVAIDLASRNPFKINALIVQNTFTSLPDVVRGWPTIGIFSFICFQKWNSASKLPRIPKALPILMLSGDVDQVVPREHMHTLWEIAMKRGGNDKDSNEQPDVPPSKDAFRSFIYGSHADTDHQPGYWHAVNEFLNSLNTP
ncbi:hypothetical protein PILCRDRAFT_814068 [Piloderma croceum F 1598]|uniref:AB hydrolase-1 domain-containing protein n=1 Tax=Piloderma croceum (strain F 1598) TaxID=765440 RepID=A0A0C3BNW1_PILCF|nr:hypothetical protein PILCRDRAFT_814068 [Piloderma croceum F 1598]